MAFSTFPLFQSHLDLAHSYWTRLIQKGDHVIDATAGNGHDTLKLATLALTENSGFLWSLDIQQQALDNTLKLLTTHGSPTQNICLLNHNHSTFPTFIPHNSIKLIVYNLGYLPGGNKNITTQTNSTLQSIQNAQPLIQHGGAISITCYPGHTEGAHEQQQILQLTSPWNPKNWNITLHQFTNRQNSPSLLLIQKQ